jgi:large subunit ribosomal protein L8e
LEEHPGDKGALGRATGCYATIIGHSDDGTSTRVRLPSGTRKTLSALCRATVGNKLLEIIRFNCWRRKN